MNGEQVFVVQRRRSRHEVEQLVAEFESSGLSRIEFCRERGLALSTLGRYRRRERQAAAGSGALLAVEVSGRAPASLGATRWCWRRNSWKIVAAWAVFPAAAHAAADISWFVTPAIAETTTTAWVFCAALEMMRSTFSMHAASPTDVPPNFSTWSGLCGVARDAF
jgi:hypothetical protein